MEATGKKLDIDKNIAHFIAMLKKKFEPAYEVYPSFSIYGPLKCIKLFKASDACPEKYYSQLLSGKSPEGKNRFEAAVIGWRMGGFDMTQYEEFITVRTFEPIGRNSERKFKWDHEHSWIEYGHPMLQKTIDPNTMGHIVQHLKLQLGIVKPSKKHHTSSVDAKNTNLARIQTYTPDTLFNFIKNNPAEGYYVDVDGNRSKLRRAKILMEIGLDCVECHLKGKFFALERWPDNSLHLDLYGIDEAGDEILITIDHILAKYNGGKDELSNYATLCKVCNELKGCS